MTDDKRRFSRITFDAEVLLSKKDTEWRTTMLDISLNGLLLNTPDNWDLAEGEHCHFEIIFADSSHLIHGEAALAHHEANHIGFQIVSIDVDSVGHLRRLVELNLGDEELLNRELALLHWN